MSSPAVWGSVLRAWELGVFINGIQVASITHNSRGWAYLQNQALCYEFAFTELWG